jgi:hypothetical protein
VVEDCSNFSCRLMRKGKVSKCILDVTLYDIVLLLTMLFSTVLAIYLDLLALYRVCSLVFDVMNPVQVFRY